MRTCIIYTRCLKISTPETKISDKKSPLRGGLRLFAPKRSGKKLPGSNPSFPEKRSRRGCSGLRQLPGRSGHGTGTGRRTDHYRTGRRTGRDHNDRTRRRTGRDHNYRTGRRTGRDHNDRTGRRGRRRSVMMMVVAAGGSQQDPGRHGGHGEQFQRFFHFQNFLLRLLFREGFSVSAFRLPEGDWEKSSTGGTLSRV